MTVMLLTHSGTLTLGRPVELGGPVCVECLRPAQLHVERAGQDPVDLCADCLTRIVMDRGGA